MLLSEVIFVRPYVLMNLFASGTQKIPSIMSQAFIFNPLPSILAFAWDKNGVANVIMILALLCKNLYGKFEERKNKIGMTSRDLRHMQTFNLDYTLFVREDEGIIIVFSCSIEPSI